MNKDILGYAVLNGGATTLYIACIALFLTYAPEWFGWAKEDTPAAPVLMLLLFVISAAITGSLVVGRPISWYLDGKRREAITLFISTLTVLVIFGAIIAVGFLR